MGILCPDADESELREMIKDGESASQMIAQKMAGTHALLVDEVERIREKNRDIRRLEENMANLAQLFQEMAALVDEQGEMLDAIEVHVHKAADYTARAEKELISTRKHQQKNRKYCCYMMVCMTIVLVAILFPILVSD